MQRSHRSAWQWRLFVMSAAAVVLGLPAPAAASPVRGSVSVDGPAAVQQETADPFVFTEDRVLVYFTVKGSHTDEFELVMNKVHDVLRASDKAERRRQAQGWKVEKVGTPLADGTYQYIFVLDPVEKGVSYNPFTILDEELPREEVVDLHLRVNEGIVKIATVPIHSLVWMGGGTR